MNLYRVKFSAKSYSILPPDENLKFTLHGPENIDTVLVRNKNSINLLGQSFSNGLSFICEFHANSIAEAISLSSGTVNQLLDNLVFVTGGPAYDIKILKAYDITQGIELREYQQYFYNKVGKVGSRARNIDETSGLIHKFLLAQEERLPRAIHWYRKSLQEANPLDRFTYIWTALETLNPLMKKIYPDEVEIAKCEKCEHPRTVEGTAALKKFFEANLSDQSLYSRARQLRQELLHGHGDLDEIMEKASKIVSPLSLALRTAICVVNGIEPEIVGYDINPDEADDVIVAVYMKFGPFTVDEADPHYKELDAELDITLEERGGELIITPTVTVPMFGSGMGIASIGFDLIGRTGYPIKKASIRFTNRLPSLYSPPP